MDERTRRERWLDRLTAVLFAKNPAASPRTDTVLRKQRERDFVERSEVPAFWYYAGATKRWRRRYGVLWIDGSDLRFAGSDWIFRCVPISMSVIGQAGNFFGRMSFVRIDTDNEQVFVAIPETYVERLRAVLGI